MRGFEDDDEEVPTIRRRTAAQKVTHLEMMLEQIANYVAIISRNTIVRNSTSINGVWQAIRQHYGLQSTGSRFLDLANIKLKADQRPEDLYQALMSFVDDLLTRASGITHHGAPPDTDEELSPSLENCVVFTWLQLLHPGLPRLVKRRYGTELRSRTLASVKPEISQALDSLLDELHACEEAKVLRAASANFGRSTHAQNNRPSCFSTRQSKPKPAYKPRPNKSCLLCFQAGRADHRSHFLSSCPHPPESDRQFMSRVRQVADIEDIPDSTYDPVDEDILDPAPPTLYNSDQPITPTPLPAASTLLSHLISMHSSTTTPFASPLTPVQRPT